MIIDASVGVKWIVLEEGSAIAASLIGREQLYAPTLFFSEVGNALLKKSRRGEIVIAEVTQSFSELPFLITGIEATHIMPRALEIAAELNHSIYDCVYLALAEEMGMKLMTADLKFAAKLSQHPASATVVSLDSIEG